MSQPSPSPGTVFRRPIWIGRAAIALLALALLLAAQSARGQSEGEPMPPLEVEEWIQGKTDEMNPWGDGKVYLLDLWGTWCLPCIRLMPRLSDLQDEYRDRDLVIVGYSWEEPARIREFVAERRAEIRYALATDSEERTMQVLSEAEVIEGFPYAFLIDGRGIVRWKGPGQDAEAAVTRFFDRNGPQH